jgi:hypothetical protein
MEAQNGRKEIGEKRKKEKTAEKTKKSKKNGEKGKNSASGRWTFCANELYLKNVPFAKRLFSRLLTARGRTAARVQREPVGEAKGNRRDFGKAVGPRPILSVEKKINDCRRSALDAFFRTRRRRRYF